MKRNFLLILLLNLVLITASVFFTIRLENKTELNNDFQQLQNSFVALSEAAFDSQNILNQSFLKNYSQKSGVEVILFEKNGKIIYPADSPEDLKNYKRAFSAINEKKHFWKESNRIYLAAEFNSPENGYIFLLAKETKSLPVTEKLPFILLIILLLALNLSWWFIFSGERKIRTFLKKSFADLWNDFEDPFFNLNKIKAKMVQKKEVPNPESSITSFAARLNQPLLLTDKSGIIIYENEKAGNLFGAIEKREIWEVLRQPQVNDLFENVAQTNQEGMLKLVINNQPLRLAIVPLSDDLLLLLFFQEDSREVLENQQREFLLNLAHELRTPLTAIKGFLETIREDPQNLNNYLQIIERQTERLLELAESILNWQSALQENEPEDVNLNELLKTILPLFEKRAADKKLQLKLELADTRLTVRSVPGLLEQLLLILLDNAVKFTRQGEITVSVKKENENLIITVADTGCGFSREIAEKIFQPFFVAEKARTRPRGGYGLGLAIARDIARRLNIEIKAESEPSKGSRFSLIFPAKN